jgi:hypothetical protein
MASLVLDFLERLGVELGVDLEAGRLVILDVPGAVHGDEIRAAIAEEAAELYVELVKATRGGQRLVAGPFDGDLVAEDVPPESYRGYRVGWRLWAVYYFPRDPSRGIFKGWTTSAAKARAGKWQGKEEG